MFKTALNISVNLTIAHVRYTYSHGHSKKRTFIVETNHIFLDFPLVLSFPPSFRRIEVIFDNFLVMV